MKSVFIYSGGSRNFERGVHGRTGARSAPENFVVTPTSGRACVVMQLS